MVVLQNLRRLKVDRFRFFIYICFYVSTYRNCIGGYRMRRCKYFYDCCRNISLPNKCICRYYVQLELDPYWKDIVDETNRRLNNV